MFFLQLLFFYIYVRSLGIFSFCVVDFGFSSYVGAIIIILYTHMARVFLAVWFEFSFLSDKRSLWNNVATLT